MPSGIRITQEGVNVRRAADYQEVLDDRWPFLEFEFVGEVRAVDTVTNQHKFVPLYTHTLGFVPAFLILIKSATPSDTSLTRIYAVEDKIGVEVNSIGFTTNLDLTVWIAVLKRNITTTYVSPSKQIVPAPYVGPQKHGVKVVARGGDIRSSRKIEFSLNTNAKSLAVHMHGVAAVNGSGLLVLTHDVGYPPTYFIAQYANNSGALYTSTPVMNGLNTLPTKAVSTTITTTIRGGQSTLAGNFAYLILKDPVDVAR